MTFHAYVTHGIPVPTFFLPIYVFFRYSILSGLLTFFQTDFQTCQFRFLVDDIKVQTLYFLY